MREIHLPEEAAKRFEEALAEAKQRLARASCRPIKVYGDGFRRVVRELRLRAEAEMKSLRPGH
jgi:hypothetical protein